jgi:hypothetical protein
MNPSPDFFDNQFLLHTSKYVAGEISLAEYKCWLFPNSHYLDPPKDHPVFEVKHLLAEYTSEHNKNKDHLTEETVKRKIRQWMLRTKDRMAWISMPMPRWNSVARILVRLEDDQDPHEIVAYSKGWSVDKVKDRWPNSGEVDEDDLILYEEWHGDEN